MGGLFSKNKKVKTIDERDKVVLVSIQFFKTKLKKLLFGELLCYIYLLFDKFLLLKFLHLAMTATEDSER